MYGNDLMATLASVDLNLLVALRALLRHRSVTHAAVEVGVSQLAMSNTLRRLRYLLGDELLIRVGKSYELTAGCTCRHWASGWSGTRGESPTRPAPGSAGSCSTLV
jgi:hypothetical protein